MKTGKIGVVLALVCACKPSERGGAGTFTGNRVEFWQLQ